MKRSRLLTSCIAGDDDPSTLDSLMDFVADNSLGKIFLAGDFNARTKNLDHDLVDENIDLAHIIISVNPWTL